MLLTWVQAAEAGSKVAVSEVREALALLGGGLKVDLQKLVERSG